MEKRTQLYVLTGFLGAGKTTILHRILKELKGEKIGVIQNEFGKVSVDGDILRNEEIQLVEINKGSIFCSSLKLNFVKALGEMAARGFDYLFVESSGLEDPSNIREILDASKIISGIELDFKGVICAIDAVNFLSREETPETVNRQLKHCNLALITKSDLADEYTLREVKEKIRELNPVCPIVLSVNGEMDMDFLGEDLMKYSWADNEETTNKEEDKPKTLFIEFDRKIPTNDLLNFLNDIKGETFRVKGFADLSETGWNKIDVVGLRLDIKKAEKKEDLSRLMVISKVGPKIIRTIDTAWSENTHIKMKIRN